MQGRRTENQIFRGFSISKMQIIKSGKSSVCAEAEQPCQPRITPIFTDFLFWPLVIRVIRGLAWRDHRHGFHWFVAFIRAIRVIRGWLNAGFNTVSSLVQKILMRLPWQGNLKI